MFGRITHYAVDAVLVSTVLAGIKRNTGLQLATDKIENEEVRKYADKYLVLGDWVIDSSVGFMSSSSFFERKK